MTLENNSISPHDSPLDTDYHRERALFAKKLFADPRMLPHRYVLVLTNLCNLRCPFCFQKKSRLPESLTTEQWLDFIDQLPDYAWVTLTGGEPLLFEGFEEVFHKVAAKHKCNIISNGVLLDEEKINLLLSEPNFRVLSVSVDNIGNTVRNVAPDLWQQTESMLQRFSSLAKEKGRNAILDIKTMVLDDNADQLFAIHRYCMEVLQCDTHAFQLLKGSPIQYADIMSDMKEMFMPHRAATYERFATIKEQLELVRRYHHETGRKCFLHPKIADLNGNTPITKLSLDYINAEDHDPDRFVACKAPWESVHINVDGNLFPCMAISMGNIKSRTLDQIINGDNFVYFKEEIRKLGTIPGCNRCGNLLPLVRKK
jgi:MoaA/NifB/PqqE/SkfB family radical SAM enzyme